MTRAYGKFDLPEMFLEIGFVLQTGIMSIFYGVAKALI